MSKAEDALIEAALEEQRLSRLLSRHQNKAEGKWWNDWLASWRKYKLAVRRVLRERRYEVRGGDEN